MARFAEFCSGTAFGLGCGCTALVLGILLLVGLVTTDREVGTMPIATKQVGRHEFGDRWPFTVGSGELLCIPPGAAVFRAKGVDYQLNGLAKSAGYAPIDPIWRDDPANPGLKIYLGEMIDLALALCP